MIKVKDDFAKAKASFGAYFHPSIMQLFKIPTCMIT